MKNGKKAFTATLAIMALFACLNTTTTPRTCSVTIDVSAGRTAKLTVEPLTPARRLLLLAERYLSTPEAGAYIPSIIANVRATVTAADMATLSRTEAAEGRDNVSFVLEVPVGMARSFFLEGLSRTNDVVFTGQVVVDLIGQQLTVSVIMTPGAITVPGVLSTSPADGATGVPWRPMITATFSEVMDPPTVGPAFSVIETASGNAVAGTAGCDGATASFMPSADLLPNTDYTVTITTGARSAYGIPLPAYVVWVFRTAPTVPAVTGTSPADGETGVSPTVVITAAFSEDMDPATITSATFELLRAAGTVTYNAPGRTATLVPGSALASNTTYTARVTTGVRSVNGAPLVQDHAWSFTTGQATDTAPPVFGGLVSVTSLSLTSVQLLWSAATDTFTPAPSIVYLVYDATASGAQDFANPLLVSAPGATTVVVGGLTPGSQYYFVVRARDEAGNIDGNTVERSVLYPGLYVDAKNGHDDTGDGSAGNPYRSLTKALSATPGNIAIYAAAGTYGRASGESFPLQLKPATTLYCRGAGASSVIDATGSGADAVYGNAGAVIENCTVVADAGKTGIDDSIGGADGTPGTAARMTVSGCEVRGPAGNAVTLSANSTVATTTVAGAGSRGIFIRTGRPILQGSILSGNKTGVEVAANTDPLIDSCRIENNTIGVIVTAAGGRPSVRNNTIADNGTGILVTAGAPLIHKNEVKTNFIAGNLTGIEITGGMPTVSFNTVTANEVGISVSGGTPTIKSNDLYCNTIVDLRVLVNTQLDARGDAWDHAPPVAALAPCAGADICYVYDVTGIPVYTPYGPAVTGGCP